MNFENYKLIVIVACCFIAFLVPPVRHFLFRKGCGCLLYSGCFMVILIVLGSIFSPVLLKIAEFIISTVLKVIISHYQSEAIMESIKEFFKEYFGIEF